MAGKAKLTRIMEPGKIGSVTTRNRFIKTGAAVMFWHEDDIRMSDTVKAFYEAFAKGGVGLLIVESPTIDYPIGARWRGRYRIDDDKYIKGLSELPKIIHAEGCPTFMQMNHDGPWQTGRWDAPGVTPVNTGSPIGSSPTYIETDNDLHNEVPHELTIEEIEVLIDKFASAAVRAQKAGFDGVDINHGSSHLGHNFLSPFWNRRTDMYGGSVENRTRFLTSIIKDIKKRLGNDFPVSVCINGFETGRIMGIDDDKCQTPQNALEAAKLIEAAGADAMHIRSHWMGYHVASFLPDSIFYPEPLIPVSSFPEGYDSSRLGAGAQLPLAAAMKKAVSIPVIAVGRLDPELGEKALKNGEADFIGMTRRLFCDPELPNKVAEGRLEDIAPCTACYTCLEPRPVKQCRINAALGSTESYEIKPAAKKKKVMVIGGGPAGMEAARVAALRKHEVVLYEKTSSLGGSIPLAATLREIDIQDPVVIVDYLKRQIEKLGVKINLGKEVDASIIMAEKPDVVIMATGGSPEIPDIPGINKPNVINTPALHRQLKSYLKFLSPDTLRWLTKFYLPIGKNAIVIGGGKQGYELAEFLVKRGRKVTIVEPAIPPAENSEDTPVSPYWRSLLDISLAEWFQRKNVPIISEAEIIEITDKGLTIKTAEGKTQNLEADSIVPALPLVPETGLLKSIKGKVPEIYTAGDCNEARLIVDAIADGWRVTRKL